MSPGCWQTKSLKAPKHAWRADKIDAFHRFRSQWKDCPHRRASGASSKAPDAVTASGIQGDDPETSSESLAAGEALAPLSGVLELLWGGQ